MRLVARKAVPVLTRQMRHRDINCGVAVQTQLIHALGAQKVLALATVGIVATDAIGTAEGLVNIFVFCPNIVTAQAKVTLHACRLKTMFLVVIGKWLMTRGARLNGDGSVDPAPLR